MIARFEIGAVILATGMGEVFPGLGQSVLPGNASFRQGHAKVVVIQNLLDGNNR